MLDLRDLTFNIPLRYDTDDRVTIFKATLTYICRNMTTNIVICESDTCPRFKELCKQIPNCTYLFDQTDSPIFHRTKLLNLMANASHTPFIVNYDVDCVVHLEKYNEAMNLLRSGEADVATGFDGFTYNVPRALHQRIMLEGTVDWLNEDMCVCANTVDKAMGGIVYWNKHKFNSVGKENENFIGWAPEDQERVYRAQKFGLKYKKVEGSLYHLEHRRTLNSCAKHPYFAQNEAEFEKIKLMTEDQLRDYIKTWSWNTN